MEDLDKASKEHMRSIKTEEAPREPQCRTVGEAHAYEAPVDSSSA